MRKALQPTIERAEASLIRYQLKRAVGGSGVSFVDVIVADLIDSEGVSGLGFSYVLAADGALSCQAAKSHLDQFVRGKPIVPPQALWKLICRSFNRTGLGPNLLGLAAIDVAMWDLYSKRMNMPLAAAMGRLAQLACTAAEDLLLTNRPLRQPRTLRCISSKDLKLLSLASVAPDLMKGY